jgi:hypothetical protein
MKTGTILDSDMSTLGLRLRDAVNWWWDELSAMMPSRSQRRAKSISGFVATYSASGEFRLAGEHASLETVGDGASLRPVTILIPDSLCLVRTVVLPAMRPSDLRKLVMLDLDRLMPFPTDGAYADVLARGEATDGSVDAEIAALPKATLHTIYNGARAHGLAPRAIGVVDNENALRFDFMPALASDGIGAAPQSGLRFWWGLVALLFVLNIGILIFRDMQSVSRVAALVETQAPAASAARRIALRIAREDGVRSELIARRNDNDALAALALATKVMPAGAWVQRYSWNGNLLRLAGYKQANVDVAAALRKSGVFNAVRASTSDVAAESATGQPFDVSAEFKPEAVRR